MPRSFTSPARPAGFLVLPDQFAGLRLRHQPGRALAGLPLAAPLQGRPVGRLRRHRADHRVPVLLAGLPRAGLGRHLAHADRQRGAAVPVHRLCHPADRRKAGLTVSFSSSATASTCGDQRNWSTGRRRSTVAAVDQDRAGRAPASPDCTTPQRQTARREPPAASTDPRRRRAADRTPRRRSRSSSLKRSAAGGRGRAVRRSRASALARPGSRGRAPQVPPRRLPPHGPRLAAPSRAQRRRSRKTGRQLLRAPARCANHQLGHCGFRRCHRLQETAGRRGDGSAAEIDRRLAAARRTISPSIDSRAKPAPA